MDRKDWTAKQIIEHLPKRLKEFESIGYETIVHFELEGDTGGGYTLVVKDGEADIQEGLIGDPKCVVRTSASSYEAIEKGEKNPMVAMLSGDLKVSNMMEMMAFSQRFYGLLSSRLED